MLVEEMRAYLAQLEQNQGLRVSIHSRIRGFSVFLSGLLPYNIHSSPYCMYIKSNRRLWNQCQRIQDRIVQKCNQGEPFFGMCPCGVYEYIIPVRDGGQTAAFLSIGGYRMECGRTERALNHLPVPQKEARRLYREALSPDIPDQQEVCAAVWALVQAVRLAYREWQAAPAEEAAGSEQSYLYGHIVEFLRQNFTRPISIREVCGFCHYSPSYVSHIFRQYGGRSIGEYLCGLRMERARQLLRQTELPIREVAAAVGFQDSNYFCNVFHRQNGMPPRTYRMKSGD